MHNDSSGGSGRSSPVGSLSRSGSMRNVNRTSLIRRNQSMSAKQIRFYRNGDRYFGGLKLAVSSERYKEFQSLLVELSQKLDLSTGAVRYIFNAEDSSLISDISQLQYGVSYVCSSINVLRHLEEGYGKHPSQWAASTPKKSQHVHSNINALATPNYNAYNNIESHKEFIKPKLVTVIKCGKPPQKKVTLLLNCKTALSLEKVFDQLSARGSLGKVDKLYTIDGSQIRDLRDLFEDDTVFIALSSNEKFPEDGIELDPNSYRITPYREMKRPNSSNPVKRSSSLRERSTSVRSNRSFKDENENMNMTTNIRGTKAPRPKSMGPGTKLTGGGMKVTRPKSGNIKSKISPEHKDELYPTSVFETESSDSVKSRKQSAVKIVNRRSNRSSSSANSSIISNTSPLLRVSTPKHTSKSSLGGGGEVSKKRELDIYNTVWLSDFESCKSGLNSMNQSSREINKMDHSRVLSKLGASTNSSFTDSLSLNVLISERPSSWGAGGLKSNFTDSAKSTATSFEFNKSHLCRTMSLPEAEFTKLTASDLSERFGRLQLEQENKQLKQLTESLKSALECIEQQLVTANNLKPESEQAYFLGSPYKTPGSPIFDSEDAQFLESRLAKGRKRRRGDSLCCTQS